MAHARGQAFMRRALVWLQWGFACTMNGVIDINPHNPRAQRTPSSNTLSVALTAIQKAMGVKIHPTN